MSVRKLCADDCQSFVALRLDGIIRYPEAFLPTRQEAEAADPDLLRAWLDRGNTFGFFADNSLAGIASFAPMQWATARHRASVGPFYVSPKQQGLGGAQALIDSIVADCLGREVDQLELWVWSGSHRAIAFYKRNGFQQHGVLPRAVITDGLERDDLFMVRQLDR